MSKGQHKALRSAAAAAVECLAGALLLLWPALWNGRPGTFPDTIQYFSQGRYIATLLHLIPAGAPVADPYGVIELRWPHALAATVMGARSASYSAFLFLTAKLGTLWLPAVLQALAAAWTCRLAIKSVLGGSQRPFAAAYIPIMGALALCTSLPYFAGWLMPDGLAGVALLLTALLLAMQERLSTMELWGSSALLSFCLAAHGSIPLMIAGVTVLFLAGGRPRGITSLKTALPILAALVVALAFNGLYQTLVRAGPAGPLHRPPFLTARVLEDQHGAGLLRKICRNADTFAVCRFKDKPLDRSEDVLWSANPARSAFLLADDRMRRRMEAEDTRVALSALFAQPISQTLATTNNVLRQFMSIWVDDPLSNPAVYARKPMFRDARYMDVVSNPGACASPVACRTTIPFALFGLIPLMTSIVSLALLIYLFARPQTRQALKADGRADLGRFVALLTILALGLVLNAIICGAFSGPFPRYQARLIWLLPLITLLGCRVFIRRPDRLTSAPTLAAPVVLSS